MDAPVSAGDSLHKHRFRTAAGPQGPDGKSAYDLLGKEEVEAGRINWPGDRTTLRTSSSSSRREGDRGADGQSAYELWKADLAKRCGTPEALTDHRDGSKWDCERNSLDDFYEFLRGADGADGKDGKDGRPGEPGKPGAEVTIIQGVPNVIAQYSQSEFGEYVRTTDGGVLYKVYDERGQLAPHAKVQGLPGIDPGKEYTSNEQGEFIVPREDLPEIQELDSRWGTTRSVTLAGKAPQESAREHLRPQPGYTCGWCPKARHRLWTTS